MITLITAVPGSGKTLYSITLIEQYNNEQRLVYQNIDGLKKDRFRYPHLILDAPSDWRDTPHGSVVIYDECQQPHLYPATAQRGQVSDPRLTAMETHRHSGHDLIFITQAPTLVHHHIRKLTGRHIHLYRARGLKSAMRYEWSHVCDSPNDRSEQQRADSTLWTFPKQFYDFYHSATIHTHKFSMPTKLKILGLFLIPSLIYFGYSATQLTFVKNDKIIEEELIEENIVEKKEFSLNKIETPVELIEKNDDSLVNNQVKKLTKPDITGCVKNHRRRMCACYDENGKIIDIDYKECLSIASNPISKSILRK